MRLALVPALLATAGALAAQGFDPTMPAPVPAVSGKVVEFFGLRYIDVKAGDGAPAAPGQEYTVHYTGWLRDGRKFDSSVDKGAPLKFVQGRRAVIAGWDAGFEGMKVGGKRRLFLPYQLAYGELGRPPAIPPKSELIFDVELLGVKDAAPQAVRRRRPQPGAARSRRPYYGAGEGRSGGEVFVEAGRGSTQLSAGISPYRQRQSVVVECCGERARRGCIQEADRRASERTKRRRRPKSR